MKNWDQVGRLILLDHLEWLVHWLIAGWVSGLVVLEGVYNWHGPVNSVDRC